MKLDGTGICQRQFCRHPHTIRAFLLMSLPMHGGLKLFNQICRNCNAAALTLDTFRQNHFESRRVRCDFGVASMRRNLCHSLNCSCIRRGVCSAHEYGTVERCQATIICSTEQQANSANASGLYPGRVCAIFWQ